MIIFYVRFIFSENRVAKFASTYICINFIFVNKKKTKLTLSLLLKLHMPHKPYRKSDISRQHTLYANYIRDISTLFSESSVREMINPAETHFWACNVASSILNQYVLFTQERKENASDILVRFFQRICENLLLYLNICVSYRAFRTKSITPYLVAINTQVVKSGIRRAR